MTVGAFVSDAIAQDTCATMIKSMDAIGMSEAEASFVWRMIAAVLCIGNLQFSEAKDGQVSVSQDVVAVLAHLLEVRMGEDGNLKKKNPNNQMDTSTHPPPPHFFFVFLPNFYLLLLLFLHPD